MWRFFQGLSRNLRTRTPAPPSQTTPRTDDSDTALSFKSNDGCLTTAQNDHGHFNCTEITQRILGQPSEADVLLREFFGPTWKSKSQYKEESGNRGQSQDISDRLLCVGLGSLWIAALTVGRAVFTTWRIRQWKEKACNDVGDWKEFEERYTDAIAATMAIKDSVQFCPFNCYSRQSNFWKSRLSVLPHSIGNSAVFAAGSKVNSKSDVAQSTGQNHVQPVKNVTKLQPNKKSVTFDQDFSEEPARSGGAEESWDSISDEVIEKFTEDAKRCSGATYGILGLQSVRSENYEQAFYRFQLGAKEGYSKALFNVGLCYEQGIGTKKDIAKAVESYEKAAFKGHTKAQYNLGLLLITKEGIADKVYGLRLLEKAALKGLVQAQSHLGSYLANPGEFQNMKKAIKMFKLAAEQGDVNAKHHLAMCYERGLGGLKRDLIQAFDLYSSAASAGHLDAKYQMAIMLNVGFEGLERDPKVAQELFESAANLGHRQSAKLLKELLAAKGNATTRKLRTGPGKTIMHSANGAIESQNQSISFQKDHPLLVHDTSLGRINVSDVLQMKSEANGIRSELMVGIMTRHLTNAGLMKDIFTPQIKLKHPNNKRVRSDFDNQISTISHEVFDVAGFSRLHRSSTSPNLCYRSPMVKDPGNSFSLEV